MSGGARREVWHTELFVVGVAQLARAPGCGPGGRGFETPRPPQQNLLLFGVGVEPIRVTVRYRSSSSVGRATDS